MTELSPEARRALDAHLRAISQALERAGRTADEIETISDAVEERVLETASPLQCSDAANMRGLLRTLDPPEDFEERGVEVATVDDGARLALIAFWIAVAGPCVGIAAGAVAGLLGSDGSAFGSLVILTLAGLGALLGLLGRRHPRGRAGLVISLSVIGAYIAILVIGDALAGR